MSKLQRILSLGAGVQSTVLLLMSCRGELPKVDAAVFADTGWEPADVYAHLEWLKREAARAGIEVHTVAYRNLRQDLVTFRRSQKSGKDYTYVPLYLRHADGTLGMNRRTCTAKYKIGPIDKWTKQHGATKDNPVDVWMGITFDESQRMRISPENWKRHVYPFCGPYGDDLLPKMWRRADCIAWLQEHYPARHVPRSACIGCPYRSNEEWRRIRDDSAAWADAIEVDAAIRQQANPSLIGVPFLHRSGVPLPQADLGEPDKWDDGLFNECEGMCGV